MIKTLLLATILVLSTPVYANSFCEEAGARGEKVMIERQKGVPKAAMTTGVYLLGLSTKAMKGFTKGMIEDVYDMPKGDKDFRPEIIKEYKKSIIKDCKRLIFFQDNL